MDEDMGQGEKEGRGVVKGELEALGGNVGGRWRSECGRALRCGCSQAAHPQPQHLIQCLHIKAIQGHKQAGSSELKHCRRAATATASTLGASRQVLKCPRPH